MQVKCGKFYADWWIGKKRFRKSFKLKKHAVAHQEKMRHERDSKNHPEPVQSAKLRSAGRKPRHSRQQPK